MSFQQVLDAFSEAQQMARSSYHLTLGKAIERLADMPKKALVVIDVGQSPDYLTSYRGYYSDLAFTPTSLNRTVAEVLKELRAARGKTFVGYKGGDFEMTDNTPLWLAEYGCCGRAITGVDLVDDRCVLSTREVD